MVSVPLLNGLSFYFKYVVAKMFSEVDGKEEVVLPALPNNLNCVLVVEKTNLNKVSSEISVNSDSIALSIS